MGTLPLAGGRTAQTWGLGENERSGAWQGGLPGPPTRAQGPWEPGLISQEWGALPGGRLVLGGPAPRMPGPTSWPETSQPRLGTKPSPGGLPPVLPSGKGVPFPDGRTGGSSQWGGRDGGVCGFAATSASCSHPGPVCPGPMEAEGRLSRDAGVLRGSRDGVGTPRETERAWARERPRENPQPWPQWLQGLPKSPAMGPGAAHPGPGSPQVNAFGGRQGREAAYAVTERGVGALGD